MKLLLKISGRREYKTKVKFVELAMAADLILAKFQKLVLQILPQKEIFQKKLLNRWQWSTNVFCVECLTQEALLLQDNFSHFTR
jgi:hypothetical protein